MQARFIRTLLIFCIGISVASNSSAQNAHRIYVEQDGWSIGTNFGVTDLWGNVGTQSILDHYTNSHYTDKICFMGGLFGRYTIHPSLSIRLSLNIGTLYATDKWNEDGTKSGGLSEGNDYIQRYLRSQDAKDQMVEGSVLFEYSFFRSNPQSKAAHKRGQPFIAAGVGVFHFTPYSTAGKDGPWVRTHDLHLEGQGWSGADYPKQYSLWQPCIPLGLGWRWDIGKHLNLGIEYMYRYTFCKYLDGVSGKYVDQRAFYSHMSADQAALAASVADKEQYNNNQLANPAGNLRGNGGNESYSTVSLTLFYKITSRDREWWHL